MTDTVAAGLRSPDHFIQQLDLGIEPGGERRLLVTAESEHARDVGMLATIVDVVGGWLILRERPQAAVPTTNIELFGLDQLEGPGVIRAEACLVAMSKRRATAEVRLDIAGRRAWATVGFAVREDIAQPPATVNGPRPPRVGRIVPRPLWELIGARQIEDGAEVALEPRLYNNAAALQGGATMALLEAAALTVTEPGEVIAGASITYFNQVRGERPRAQVRWRDQRLVVVDVSADDGATTTGATAVFGLLGRP